MTDPNDNDRRILVLVPAADAAAARAALEDLGTEHLECSDVAELATQTAQGALALLLTVEVAEQPGFALLVEALRKQPPWSDLPIVLLTSRDGESPQNTRAASLSDHMLVLERPVGRWPLVSALRSAARSRQVQYALRRLQDMDHRKDEFLATLAHELRNPLAPIRNAIEIMRVDGRDQSAVQQAARTMIERQLEQMVRLVDDLLDVSRITRGRLELRKERVDLGQSIRAAVDTSRPLIDAAHHELAVELPSTPVYLDADPVRLAQVFANVLNNAARYTDRGGRLRVSAQREGAQVVVKVSDTGMGIPAEALPRVFNMFSQVDGTREPSRTGLGVGLAIVKRLVELHGGSVAVHSDGPGRGTEVTVRLPTAATANTARAPAAGNSAPSRPIAHRILVADDNRDAAESMGMLLRLMGNEVRTAYDGVDAVEQAEAFRPDLILLDIGMPKLNGYDAAKRIREKSWSAGTMLVAVTGWGQEEDKRRTSEAGFDCHFTKPLDPAALHKLVAEFRAD